MEASSSLQKCLYELKPRCHLLCYESLKFVNGFIGIINSPFLKVNILATSHQTRSNWQGSHHFQNCFQVIACKEHVLLALLFMIISWLDMWQSNCSLLWCHTFLFICDNQSAWWGNFLGIPLTSVSNSRNQGFAGHFRASSRTLCSDYWFICA